MARYEQDPLIFFRFICGFLWNLIMTYSDMIKEFKKDIIEGDIKDTEFIKKFEISKKYNVFGSEEVTVHITYVNPNKGDYGRRLFAKPKKRSEEGVFVGTASTTLDNITCTFTNNNMFTINNTGSSQ